jgi:hypothetical protein
MELHQPQLYITDTASSLGPKQNIHIGRSQRHHFKKVPGESPLNSFMMMMMIAPAPTQFHPQQTDSLPKLIWTGNYCWKDIFLMLPSWKNTTLFGYVCFLLGQERSLYWIGLGWDGCPVSTFLQNFSITLSSSPIITDICHLPGEIDISPALFNCLLGSLTSE